MKEGEPFEVEFVFDSDAGVVRVGLEALPVFVEDLGVGGSVDGLVMVVGLYQC